MSSSKKESRFSFRMALMRPLSNCHDGCFGWNPACPSSALTLHRPKPSYVQYRATLPVNPPAAITPTNAVACSVIQKSINAMLLFQLFQILLPLSQILFRFRHLLRLVVQNCVVTPSASLPQVHWYGMFNVPTRYRFWKLNPFNLSHACFASITSS